MIETKLKAKMQALKAVSTWMGLKSSVYQRKKNRNQYEVQL